MEFEKLVSLIKDGGPAVTAALLVVLAIWQRKDLHEARKRVVELENKHYELSSSYNKTIRKFEHGFSQTRELLTRIMDRL